ncbi:MAG: hypothetical protein WBZ19_10810 [Chthoniobacterales bacterium]
MYLLLGEPNLHVVEAFRAAVEERGQSLALLKDFDEKPHFTWQFNNGDSISRLSIRGQKIDVRQIRGVLVQNPPRLDLEKSHGLEAEYAKAESSAILFAWFWSLSCPVINRYPAQYWFPPRISLPFWERLIRASGLKTATAILSNVEPELQKFAASVGRGTCYSPLCDSEVYRVSTKQDWKELAKMAEICPVNLTRFVAPRYVACVVANKVFWNRRVTDAMLECELPLVRLTQASELDFMEFHFTADDELYVHWVEPFPKLDDFDNKARSLIAAALVDRLDSALQS